MNKYYRDNLIHGFLVFVDSLIAWVGLYLMAVGLVGCPTPISLTIGALLAAVGTLLTVVELRAFCRREYDEHGFPIPISSKSKRVNTIEVDRQPFQFGLRTLFLLMWFISLALSWWYCIKRR